MHCKHVQMESYKDQESYIKLLIGAISVPLANVMSGFEALILFSNCHSATCGSVIVLNGDYSFCLRFDCFSAS